MPAMVMVKHVPCPNCGVYMEFKVALSTRHGFVLIFNCKNCPKIKLIVNVSKEYNQL